MTALHLFDMDGTLLRGTSASLEVGRQVGRVDEIEELEIASSAGLMDNLEFHRSCLPVWRDVREEHIEAAFVGAPWMTGIAEVWADIEARGERSAVISMSPAFFVGRLRRWGVDTTHASVVPLDGPLDAAGVLSVESKVTVTEELLAEYGLAPEDCVAYGDSYTDVALFRAMPNTVAVNGDPHLRALARVVHEGPDLRGAYRQARRLLEARWPHDPDG